MHQPCHLNEPQSLLDDGVGNSRNTRMGETNDLGSAQAQINHAATDEGATIIDAHNDGLASAHIGDLNAGAERKFAMCRCQPMWIEALTIGRESARLVVRCHALNTGISRHCQANPCGGQHSVKQFHQITPLIAAAQHKAGWGENKAWEVQIAAPPVSGFGENYLFLVFFFAAFLAGRAAALALAGFFRMAASTMISTS
jgi:hypothetical protein